jgi:sec-independent protein translocase protein TatA
MLGFVGGIGITELLVILGIVILLFGAKRIPELARGLGKGVNEFKKGLAGEATPDEAKPTGEDAAKPEKTVGPRDPA